MQLPIINQSIILIMGAILLVSLIVRDACLGLLIIKAVVVPFNFDNLLQSYWLQDFGRYLLLAVVLFRNLKSSILLDSLCELPSLLLFLIGPNLNFNFISDFHC
jgi:hypothetical protein